MLNTAAYSRKHMAEGENEYDLFMSYSHADSEAIVETLVEELEAYDIDVWYDKVEVSIGDSITESIDEGLGKSDFGVVVLSEGYFEGTSDWELKGIVNKHTEEENVILPLWHGIGYDDVYEQSPSLAGIRAEELTNGNVQTVATELFRIVAEDDEGVETWGEDDEDETPEAPSFTNIDIRFQEHFDAKIGKEVTVEEWLNHNAPSKSSLEAAKIRDEERDLTFTSSSRGTMMTVKRIDDEPITGRITDISNISSGKTEFTMRVDEARLDELPDDRNYYKSGLV